MWNICHFDELPNIVLTNDSSPRKFTKLCQSRLTNSGKLPADISSYVSVRNKNNVNIPIFMRLFPLALVENVHVFCACTELRTRIYGMKSIYGSIIPIQYFYLKKEIRIVTNLLVIRQITVRMSWELKTIEKCVCIGAIYTHLCVTER